MITRRTTRNALLVLSCALTLASSASAYTISGKVLDRNGDPVPRASVQVVGTRLGTIADDRGAYELELPEGEHRIRFTSIGYEPSVHTLTVTNDLTLEIALHPRDIVLPGIQISVLRPDLEPEAGLDASEIRATRARDAGDLLRTIPGVDAVRRGPLGLDPSVRGLRESEVGVYIDGARSFPAGPGRMDSPLSHLDPSAVDRIQVVKGPYALTWGSGNLSGIRVRTPDPWDVARPVRASLQGGYDSNLSAAETSLSVAGNNAAAGYWLHGAWRSGDDYDSGSGARVPADFESKEFRGKLGFRPNPSLKFLVGGGYQKQDDIDYPGRLLTAEYFEASDVSLELAVTPEESRFRNGSVLFYIRDTDHGMNNSGKPTAEPNPNRMPPFPLDIRVVTQVTTVGVRTSGVVDLTEHVETEVGMDVTHTTRDAVRAIRRADTDVQLFSDIIWPDAVLTTTGFFARLASNVNDRTRLSLSARADVAQSDAGPFSDFFEANTTGPYDVTDTDFSAAASVRSALSEQWTVSLGAGSAVRVPDALERYSDRFPASKAQMAAEFMGNPQLQPERSNQVDVWLEGSFPRVRVMVSGFYRRISNYITIEPTALPKRLPLSPNTVFRYVNGAASFTGVEAVVSAELAQGLGATLNLSALRGEDTELDEPAIGVTPLKADLGLRYSGQASIHPYVEATLHAVAKQDRVALTRGEQPTDGRVTVDLEAGIRPAPGIELQVGVINLTDKEYANHLNSKNPFTGERVPEPGRSVFARVTLSR